MNIIKTTLAPMILGSAMTLSSCGDSPSMVQHSREKVLTEIMADKPVKDFDKIVENWGYGYSGDIKAQSSLDSVAYRNIFEGTVLANNSDKVKEFNAIAKNARPDAKSVPNTCEYNQVIQAQDSKIKDLGISKKAFDLSQKEYEKIGSRHSNGIAGTRWEPDYSKIIATRQYKADSLAYNNFFKENKVLTDSLRKEIKKVAKVIKP